MAPVTNQSYTNLYTLMCLFLACSRAASAQSGPAVSQRRVNDYAASLERCRREILETPHLRLAGEPLPAYLARVCTLLPGEAKTAYLNRVSGYVRSVAIAVDSTESARVLPTLKHADSSNLALWTRAVRDLGYLPKRMTFVRAAWRGAELQTDPAHCSELATQMLQTLQLMIDAYSNLRDAEP